MSNPQNPNKEWFMLADCDSIDHGLVILLPQYKSGLVIKVIIVHNLVFFAFLCVPARN